jgi:uncharacterized membrane protein
MNQTANNASEDMASTPTARHPAQRLRAIAMWRWACLFFVIALITLGLGWELWWAPLPGGSGALALKVLPLTLCLGGMLAHRMYAYRVMSLLVWLYVLEGSMRAMSDQGLSQYLAWLETVLSMLLFSACAVYIRLRLKVLPPKAKPQA